MPKYSFTLNGKQVSVDAPGDLSVLWTLRDKLGVTGPKYGCGINVCKACTSHLDGEPFNPCVTNLRDIAGKEVTTIEGLAKNGKLHPVQEAWLEQDVSQCGYCQPGQIMAAVALLKKIPHPTDADIDTIQNVCRCGTYPRIRAAIKVAAGKMARLNAKSAAAAAGGGTFTPTVAAQGLPATGLPVEGAVLGTAAMATAIVAKLIMDSQDEVVEEA
ncbi:MAG: (2Fe-2S)-binding protein [Mycobacteriales bacterium]